MKTALYSRVSTQEQVKEGYSLGAQKEKLETYAKLKDFSPIEHYTDGGLSGGNIERPALQKMILDIERGNIDVVVVYKLDRISRSQKDTLYLVQDVFKKNNVDFVSLEENIDTSTPMGILMIGVLSAFAELERSTITQRSLMGREKRAKDGYYHGGGNYSPLGYDYVNGELVINEYESEIVKEIFKLYIEGNSMVSTAKKIWTKYPDKVKSKTIVKDVVKNSLYIGKVKFNENEYAGRHTPIIDEETFYAAQRIRKQRRNGRSGTNKRKGLLVGKLYCAHCGARFGRDVSGPKKYRYVHYKCYSRKSSASRYLVKDRNCKNKIWKEEELNEKVINVIKELNFHAYTLESPDVQSVTVYEKEIDAVNKRIEKLLELYTMESIDKDMLTKQMQSLTDKKEQLYGLIDDIKETPIPTEVLNSLADFDWDNEKLENKTKVIDALIDRIVVDNDDVAVYFNFT